MGLAPGVHGLDTLIEYAMANPVYTLMPALKRDWKGDRMTDPDAYMLFSWRPVLHGIRFHFVEIEAFLKPPFEVVSIYAEM